MLEMEITELYENMGFWENDLGLPEVTWTNGLFSSSQEEIRQESVLEGDSILKDADFPLKEANKNKLNKPLIDDTFDFSHDLLENGWLDERIDIGAELESFIYSPEFEGVFNDLSDSDEFLKSVTEDSSTTSKESNLPTNLSIEIESSEVELEIEINEGSLEDNTIYYLNPCQMSSSPSTSDSDNIHYVISPSVPESNEETVDHESLDSEYIEVKLISENADSQHFEGKTICENRSSSSASSKSCSSLKSKRGRRKLRVEPYKDTSEDSCTSGISSSNGSSAPASPQSDNVFNKMVSTPKCQERKKYQNRNAANKYRQKKRELTEAISNEEQELVNKNKELKDKADQLANEVGYLKKLMREILVAKGLLKK